MKEMNDKDDLKLRLLLIFAMLLPFFILFYLAYRPDLRYNGDRTVNEQDIIRLEWVTLRDLRMDESREYEDDGIKLLRKSYIVKKNFLSTEKLHKELSSFCYDYYDNQSEFDEIDFDFYRECPEMPWFWNNDGYFYDLETNWDNLVAVYGIGKEGLAFRIRKTFFSKEIFGRSPPLYQTEEERE